MDAPIQKLLEIASDSIAPLDPAHLSPASSLDAAGSALTEMLGRKNGFFCFESALHVFPAVTVDASWGIQDWNDPPLWKQDFKGLADGLFCFAEDIFAHQFHLGGDGVYTFDPETGDREAIASTLTEWAEKTLLDYNVLAGYPLAHQWQEENGVLQPRQRLHAKATVRVGWRLYGRQLGSS